MPAAVCWIRPSDPSAAWPPEIIERNGARGHRRLALVGIHTRGVEVARRLADLIEESRSRPARFRHARHFHAPRRPAPPRPADLHPAHAASYRPGRAHGDPGRRRFFHGPHGSRRARCAGANSVARGRIQLASLVDRGHRELPIRPDYTGLEVATDLGRTAYRSASRRWTRRTPCGCHAGVWTFRFEPALKFNTETPPGRQPGGAKTSRNAFGTRSFWTAECLSTSCLSSDAA